MVHVTTQCTVGHLCVHCTLLPQATASLLVQKGCMHMQIIETKVKKLEQLVRLKDAKIQTLIQKMQAAGLAWREGNHEVIASSRSLCLFRSNSGVFVDCMQSILYSANVSSNLTGPSSIDTVISSTDIIYCIMTVKTWCIVLVVRQSLLPTFILPATMWVGYCCWSISMKYKRYGTNMEQSCTFNKSNWWTKMSDEMAWWQEQHPLRA